jgi:hypothetical protein
VAFTRAEKANVFLKIACMGPSGSGKTYGALQLAFGLAGANGRVALVDTENGSAELYADLGAYDVLRLEPPFLSKKYMEAIREAVEADYDVLVIDSISHQWAGEGGILSRKEGTDARGGNSFTNWAPYTKEHQAFIAYINNAPIHIVSTMRSKVEYVIDSGGGKAAPKKMGMAAVQREGMEYEYTTVFDIAMNHEARTSKDRTGLFDDQSVVLSPATGKQLAGWLTRTAPIGTGKAGK